MDIELLEKATQEEILKAKKSGHGISKTQKYEIENIKGNKENHNSINKNKKSRILKGRFNRSRYWIDSLMGIILIMVILSNTITFMGASYVVNGGNEIIGSLMINFRYIILIMYLLLVSARRFNDLNKNSWYSLLILIPIINILIFIWLGFIKGTEGDNKYGEDQTKITN